MKQVMLHIGRHKSGTTAIQKYLSNNVRLLNSNGFDYPKIGMRGNAHHEISELLASYRWKLFAKRRIVSLDLVRELNRKIEENVFSRLILSSEAFQNCRPSLVSRALDNFDVNIIVYLRRHIDYVASSYAQTIHASSYAGSLGEYIRDFYKVDYWRFLTQWENFFPRKLKVRVYDRASFPQGCVVRDFLQSGLGIECVQGDTAVNVDANPSLNSKVLQFKLRLNRSGSVKKYSNNAYQYLIKMNEIFPAGKCVVDDKCRKLIVDSCRKSDAKVFDRYLDDENFIDYAVEGVDDTCTSISESEYKEMLKVFESIVA